MNISHLDNIANNYSVGEYDLAKSLFEERVAPANWMLSMIPSNSFKKSTLIDIGSGQGSLLYAAAKLGVTHLIGIEPFPFNSDRNDDNPFLANASRQFFRDNLILLSSIIRSHRKLQKNSRLSWYQNPNSPKR